MASAKPEDILMPGGKAIGVPGRGHHVREVSGDLDKAKRLFNDLTIGGTIVTSTGYSGTIVQLPGGGHVGLRARSKSGPPTIDINVPGIPVKKIKFV